MNSKIDQEVIDELIAMLEDHIAGGLGPKKEAEVPGVEESAEEETAEPAAEEGAEPKSEEDDEDMKKLMELYSRG
jgi:hypothetical protein